MVQYNELKDSIEPYLTSIYETTKQKITSELGDTPEAKELLTKAEEINKKPSWNDQEMKDLEKEVEKAKENAGELKAKREFIESVLIAKPEFESTRQEWKFKLVTDNNKIQELQKKYTHFEIQITAADGDILTETKQIFNYSDATWGIKTEGSDYVLKVKTTFTNTNTKTKLYPKSWTISLLNIDTGEKVVWDHGQKS